MDEYIKREAVRLAIFNTNWRSFEDVEIAYEIVDEIPAADVTPVVHGQWEVVNHYPYPDTIRCSVCGREFCGNEDWVRCPVCEARMDGDTDDS